MLYFIIIIKIHKNLKLSKWDHTYKNSEWNWSILNWLYSIYRRYVLHIGQKWIVGNTYTFLIVEKKTGYTQDWKVFAVTQHFLYPFVGKKKPPHQRDTRTLFIWFSTWHLSEYEVQTSWNHHATPVTCNVYTWKTASGEKVLSRCHSFNCDCITARQIAMGIRKHKHSLSAGC